MKMVRKCLTNKFIFFVMVIVSLLLANSVFSSNCSTIKNKDARQACRALIQNRASLCNGIGDKDIRRTCKATIQNKYSLCGSIKDKREKPICRERVDGYTTDIDIKEYN